MWNDEIPTPKSVTKGLHDKQNSKFKARVDFTPYEPPSPDKLVMEKIVELRGKQGGRELKIDNEISRNDQLVQGK